MSLTTAKKINQSIIKETKQIQKSEKEIAQAKIYLGGKTQVNTAPSNKSYGNSKLAYIGLGILLLVLIVLSLFTARFIIGDKKTEVIYMENTRVIERQIQQNVTNNHIVTIPEGDRETCIKLSNESFRRCYDE